MQYSATLLRFGAAQQQVCCPSPLACCNVTSLPTPRPWIQGSATIATCRKDELLTYVLTRRTEAASKTGCGKDSGWDTVWLPSTPSIHQKQ